MTRIAYLAIMTIVTGCPLDDGTATATNTETGVDPTVGSPDLPLGTSTSESGTTAGDGDATGDGDPTTGDGDPGDGDGDTGSEAVPASLIVESNGQRIGYLMLVQEYGFYIWDDVNEITFSINQITGHVVGGPRSAYHTTADCSGSRYLNSGTPVAYCDLAGPPVRRSVTGEGAAAGGGHVAADNLVTSTGEPQLVNAQSYSVGQDCLPTMIQLCAYAIQTTNVIPKTFALPITVAESLAMP